MNNKLFTENTERLGFLLTGFVIGTAAWVAYVSYQRRQYNLLMEKYGDEIMINTYGREEYEKALKSGTIMKYPSRSTPHNL